MKKHNRISSLALGFSLIFTGCGAPAPMPAQSRAFSVVSRFFQPALQHLTLSEPQVQWWTTPCPGTDETAVIFGDTCYSGLFYGGSSVEVAWRGSIGHSAYS